MVQCGMCRVNDRFCTILVLGLKYLGWLIMHSVLSNKLDLTWDDKLHQTLETTTKQIVMFCVRTKFVGLMFGCVEVYSKLRKKSLLCCYLHETSWNTTGT